MNSENITLDEGQKWLREAIEALHSKNSGGSRTAALKAIEMGEDGAAVWGVLALACRDQGDFDMAQKAADRSIELEPRNVRAHIVKADAFYAESNVRAAAAFYRHALAMSAPQPGMPEELRFDLERAKIRSGELRDSFGAHLSLALGDLLSDQACTPRMQEALDLLLGNKRVFYSEPRHFMFPRLPSYDFFPSDQLPWLKQLGSKTSHITAELEALLKSGSAFLPYVEANSDRPTFDAHGMEGNADWGALYLWQNGEPVLENQEACPITTEAISSLPLVFSGRRCPNVLFSRLKAGASIPPHNGMINTRLIGHLPLVIPDRCGFRVGSEVREWVLGEPFLFDDTVEHEAWNKSDQDRVILIFEVWRPELTKIEKAFVTRMLDAVDTY